jgi:hypothetical protein
MAWPKGVPCPDHVKEKIRRTWLNRCDNPAIKSAWKRTDAAQTYWYAKVNQNSDGWPIPSKGEQQ